MWRTLISSWKTQGPVLQILFLVLEYWPAHRRCTSDGDDTDVFALAATVALWEILQLSWFPSGVKDNSPRLLLTLFFQVFISTEEMSEEVDTFWRRCREQRSLPTAPNRFAVQTIKALLGQLVGEDVLLEIDRKYAWDTLLNTDTHHYAVGGRVAGLAAPLRDTCASGALTRSVFPGIAGRYLREEQQELQLIYQALQAMTDDSPAISNLASQTIYIIRPVRRASFFKFW
ncbi:uncharacterized protein LOC114073520 [Empidonax traillii]|uniref:uncharacterized protein LOC114073520 n=1 Tax=Empidonax traillii TaxID=164674 RepID=UPI000FFCF9CE|nr:uncharacterized protein LOC114073520 [Empidonax traillii]